MINIIAGSSKKTNLKVPTFKEVLNFVNGRVPLLIEIKSEDKKKLLAPYVLKELNEYNGEFAIQSFNFYVWNCSQLDSGY